MFSSIFHIEQTTGIGIRVTTHNIESLKSNSGTRLGLWEVDPFSRKCHLGFQDYKQVLCLGLDLIMYKKNRKMCTVAEPPIIFFCLIPDLPWRPINPSPRRLSFSAA